MTIDYNSAALTLGVDVASVKAVAEVESNGSGFITDRAGNTVPKILFERHIMFKRLRDCTPLPSKALSAQYPDLVNPVGGGYSGGLAEHDRLTRAVMIDRVTALESCSWGAYQVMGYHWKLLGYSSVQELVNKAYTEDGQLELFVRFIKANPNLAQAIRNKDWVAFARGYNGPAYATNKYDKKMADAYEKHKR